jgi:hypothetical protein
MEFKVTGKRSGDSVQFDVTAEDTKSALHQARSQAKVIFGYKDGEPDPPTVAVKPIAEE